MANIIDDMPTAPDGVAGDERTATYEDHQRLLGRVEALEHENRKRAGEGADLTLTGIADRVVALEDSDTATSQAFSEVSGRLCAIEQLEKETTKHTLSMTGDVEGLKRRDIRVFNRVSRLESKCGEMIGKYNNLDERHEGLDSEFERHLDEHHPGALKLPLKEKPPLGSKRLPEIDTSCPKRDGDLPHEVEFGDGDDWAVCKHCGDDGFPVSDETAGVKWHPGESFGEFPFKVRVARVDAGGFDVDEEQVERLTKWGLEVCGALAKAMGYSGEVEIGLVINPVGGKGFFPKGSAAGTKPRTITPQGKPGHIHIDGHCCDKECPRYEEQRARIESDTKPCIECGRLDVNVCIRIGCIDASIIATAREPNSIIADIPMKEGTGEHVYTPKTKLPPLRYAGVDAAPEPMTGATPPYPVAGVIPDDFTGKLLGIRVSDLALRFGEDDTEAGTYLMAALSTIVALDAALGEARTRANTSEMLDDTQPDRPEHLQIGHVTEHGTMKPDPSVHCCRCHWDGFDSQTVGEVTHNCPNCGSTWEVTEGVITACGRSACALGVSPCRQCFMGPKKSGGIGICETPDKGWCLSWEAQKSSQCDPGCTIWHFHEKCVVPDQEPPEGYSDPDIMVVSVDGEHGAVINLGGDEKGGE